MNLSADFPLKILRIRSSNRTSFLCVFFDRNSTMSDDWDETPMPALKPVAAPAVSGWGDEPRSETSGSNWKDQPSFGKFLNANLEFRWHWMTFPLCFVSLVCFSWHRRRRRWRVHRASRNRSKQSWSHRGQSRSDDQSAAVWFQREDRHREGGQCGKLNIKRSVI